MALPQVIGEFRCGGDPNLRFSPNGTAVCRIRAVATSRKKGDDGEWRDDKTAWVDLVGFKRLAENMAESFKKGDLVEARGRLQVDDWEDNEGNKRTSVNIVLDGIGMSVQFNAASSHRSERSNNGGGSQGASADSGGFDRRTTPDQNDPWQTPPPDEPPF